MNQSPDGARWGGRMLGLGIFAAIALKSFGASGPLSALAMVGLAVEGVIILVLFAGQVRFGALLAVTFFGLACIVHSLALVGVLTVQGCGCLGRASSILGPHRAELIAAGLLGCLALRVWAKSAARLAA